jgi:hypothetical protein
MTRGRHRQPSSKRSIVPLAAVGVLAATGALLALVDPLSGGGPMVFRLGLVATCALAGVLAAVLWRREQQHAQAQAVEASARRRDQSLFQGQLDALQETISALREQVEQTRLESAALCREIEELRTAKVQVEETLRRLSSAPVDLAPEPSAPAAKALAGFEVADDADWISSWVSGLFDDEGDLVIELTMHDDTLPLAPAAARAA